MPSPCGIIAGVSEAEGPETEISEVDRRIAKLDLDLIRDDAIRHGELSGQIAMSAWRGLVLVNGGAIIALFTLVGSGAVRVVGDAIWWAFAAFSMGLALALASNICGYLGQAYWLLDSSARLWNARDRMHGRPGSRPTDKWDANGMKAAYASFFTATLALLAFIAGAWLALSAGLTEAGNVLPPLNVQAAAQ